MFRGSGRTVPTSVVALANSIRGILDEAVSARGERDRVRGQLEEVQRDIGIREKERDAAVAQRVTAQTAFDDLRASVATDDQEVQGLRVRLGEAEKARDDVIAERSKLEADLQTWKGASVENQRLRAQLVYERKKSQDRLSLLGSLQRQFQKVSGDYRSCLLYTSPSPRDQRGSRMPSSA